MGFGNPYNDVWNIDTLLNNIDILRGMEIRNINISDTIGMATPFTISDVFHNVFDSFSDINFGLHLHTERNNWYDKIDAAYNAGVTKFDSVISGTGGCPMTGYELVGNLDTINLIDYLTNKNEDLFLNKNQFDKSINMSKEIYSYYC